jgi:preprotein translocase subunit YajC
MDTPLPSANDSVRVAATEASTDTQAELLVTYDAAPAAGDQGGMPDMLMNMAPYIAVFAIIYFLILRPQQQEQKEHQTLLAALQKGDHVITSNGMHGVIHEVRGDELVIEIADRVRVTFDRSAVKRKAEQKAEG